MQFRQEGKKNFDKFFDKSVIKKISRASGFEKRKSRKIRPYFFVIGFLLMCSKSKNTFAEWAAQIRFVSGSTVSKQGVWERMQGNGSRFAEDLLKHFMLIQSGLASSCRLFKQFGKVLLQDSTVLKLPETLAHVFPGNTSRGRQKSQVRIQTIINVTCMRFLHFSLSGFTSNDQSASGQIMAYAAKGDLVIRDLGYFVTKTFENMLQEGVHFLSRLRYGILLKTPEGKAIKLSGLLKKGKQVDMQVLVGEKQLAVRLVMIPLPKAVANERIRKAKCDRDKRLNHCEEYYLWLRYRVFITTVDQLTWTPQQVAEAYKIRWQIEIIFKSWKSGAGLDKILHERVADENRVKVIIYFFLLFICLFTENIYNPLRTKIDCTAGRQLSLLKCVNYTMKNMLLIFGLSNTALKREMIQHCCYELRKNRTNMADLITKFKN